MSGLLVNGTLIHVPGLRVIAPASHGGPEWAQLSPSDYRQRKRGSWVRQVILHTTKGIDPQRVLRGSGMDRGKRVADFWRRDPEHSAAHMVIGSDGQVVCLADLGRHAAFHATASNEWSVGIEVYQESGGGIYQAALDAADLLVPAVCAALGMPWQVLADQYTGTPRSRLLDGGRDVVGVIGHRDNTARRGRGDPGDELIRRQLAAGAVPFSLIGDLDLEIGRARQRTLMELHGAKLEVDGVCGPSTMRAVRAAGYARWADVPQS